LLSEVFKDLGFDGVKYRSLLGEENGYSYALVKLEDAELVNCGVCRVMGITHSSSEEFETYDVVDGHRFHDASATINK
jgi:hypothetical protein